MAIMPTTNSRRIVMTLVQQHNEYFQAAQADYDIWGPEYASPPLDMEAWMVVKFFDLFTPAPVGLPF
jgi:hypothetical protein